MKILKYNCNKNRLIYLQVSIEKPDPKDTLIKYLRRNCILDIAYIHVLNIDVCIDNRVKITMASYQCKVQGKIKSLKI